MTTFATSLLDFLLNLFRDPKAAKEYEDNPREALDAAGLYDVAPEDVEALRPMVEDSSPMAYGRKNHCDDDDRGGYGGRDKDDDDRGGYHGGRDKDDCDDDRGRPHHDGHGHSSPDIVAVTHVKYVENNYDIDVDIDARNSVWAGGDAVAIWGDDVVLATGGSVAAGDDVRGAHVDNSSTDVDVDVDIEDSFNEDNSTNSHNTDTNIADRGGVVEDNDTTVTVDDVTIINDSLNGATIAGGDVTDKSVEVEVEGNNQAPLAVGGDATDESQTIEFQDEVENTAFNGGEVEDNDIEFEDEAENVAFNGGEVEDNDVESEIENSLVGQNAVAGDEAENEAEFEYSSETEFEVDEALIVVIPEGDLQPVG